MSLNPDCTCEIINLSPEERKERLKLCKVDLIDKEALKVVFKESETF